MKKKSRALDFKKGDRVVYLNHSYGRVDLTEGIVTLVRKDMPCKRWDSKILNQAVVYVQFQNQWGHLWTKKFADEFGHFQQDPYPLWQLRHLVNGEMANLGARAKHASKLYAEYEAKVKAIEVDVEQEAREWKYREIDRRKKEIPHGGAYLNNVIARLGFKGG